MFQPNVEQATPRPKRGLALRIAGLAVVLLVAAACGALFVLPNFLEEHGVPMHSVVFEHFENFRPFDSGKMRRAPVGGSPYVQFNIAKLRKRMIRGLDDVQ